MKYLSDAWLSSADSALKSAPCFDIDLTIGFRIRQYDGTSTDREYTLAFGADRPHISPGCVDCDLVLVLDWDLACAIAKGEAGALRAFLDGQLTFDGNPGVLLGHQGQLARFDDHLAELRAITDFG